MPGPHEISADWKKATQIASKFPNKQCLETAAALSKEFGAAATVLYVNTTGLAMRPYIIHPSLPGDIISETGIHFAVELHGKVFDNLTPDGAEPREWARSFEFAAHGFKDSTFEDAPIERWSCLQFLDYLRRNGRTPLGRIKGAMAAPPAARRSRS